MLNAGRMALFAFSLGFLFSAAAQEAKVMTFGEDLEFLKKHTDVLVLSDSSGGSQVAVAPKYQGRVMTSTARGAQGPSYGWINRELIAAGKIQPHINVYGGEERFWLGPEGGQFSVFFQKDAPFDLEHWQTPAIMDTEPFDVVSTTQDRAAFRKRAKLPNRFGSTFDIQIDREIRLLDPKATSDLLGTPVPASVQVVAYQTDNTLTNSGREGWSKETGLLSIWLLGMFNPSPKTTIVIPCVSGSEEALGPKVNDAYFGKVPADRLLLKDSVLFFKGDGLYRSKIGLSPKRAKAILGSYDASQGLLTLVQYNKPDGATDYVNSMWEIQKAPFAGDVVNSYNDGPPAPGAKPLGPFYELETSSPAAGLKPGETLRHIQQTFHIQGPPEALDAIAIKALGVSLKEITTAFPG